MACRLLAVVAFAGAVLCASVHSVLAHAFLDRATPAVGSTVHAPPPEVRIQFTEDLEPAFSTAHVEDSAGAIVSAGAAQVDKSARDVLIVPLNPLGAGRYKVVWRVISVDTHVTNGEFRFTVAP